MPRCIWDLSFLTRDGTYSPCIGRSSLNHRTAREVPTGLEKLGNWPKVTSQYMAEWKFQPGNETPKPYFLITISVSLQNTEGVEEGGEISLSSFQGWETNICVEAEAAIWSPQFRAGGKRVHANQNLASDTYNTRAFACALRVTPAFG